MDDKETILISHEHSIEKLIIENDKLRLENFLNEDIISISQELLLIIEMNLLGQVE
jgi:hypothetical protein